MKKPILIALASALITAGAIKASPAQAESQPAAAQVNVSLVRTADLDLQSEAGKRQLQQRLVRAAREVCGPASDADLEGKNDLRKCRVEALNRATPHGEELIAAARRGAIIAVTATR